MKVHFIDCSTPQLWAEKWYCCQFIFHFLNLQLKFFNILLLLSIDKPRIIILRFIINWLQQIKQVLVLLLYILDLFHIVVDLDLQELQLLVLDGGRFLQVLDLLHRFFHCYCFIIYLRKLLEDKWQNLCATDNFKCY